MVSLIKVGSHLPPEVPPSNSTPRVNCLAFWALLCSTLYCGLHFHGKSSYSYYTLYFTPHRIPSNHTWSRAQTVLIRSSHLGPPCMRPRPFAKSFANLPSPTSDFDFGFTLSTRLERSLCLREPAPWHTLRRRSARRR